MLLRKENNQCLLTLCAVKVTVTNSDGLLGEFDQISVERSTGVVLVASGAETVRELVRVLVR